MFKLYSSMAVMSISNPRCESSLRIKEVALPAIFWLGPYLFVLGK